MYIHKNRTDCDRVADADSSNPPDQDFSVCSCGTCEAPVKRPQLSLLRRLEALFGRESVSVRALTLPVILFVFLNCAGYALAGGTRENDFLIQGGRYLASGNYYRAVRTFEQAVALHPSNAEVWRRLGESYRKLGDNEVTTDPELLEKAVRAYRMALSLEPGLKAVHLELGITFLALHDLPGALLERERLEKIDKDLAAQLAAAIKAWKPEPVYRALAVSDESEGNETRVSIEGNMVLAPVTLYAGSRIVQAQFLVDTGASITTISSEVATRLGINLAGAFQSAVQVVGGSMVRARVVRLDRVAVGSRSKRNMPVAVINHKGPLVNFDGLLGMDFLREHRYHIDFRNRAIVWDK